MYSSMNEATSSVEIRGRDRCQAGQIARRDVAIDHELGEVRRAPARARVADDGDDRDQDWRRYGRR